MAPKTPPPGSLFAARYRIESSLGEGGMGVVLAAVDERTGIDCAIKVLGADAIASDTPRLLREARALMLLESPHVVRIFDLGEAEGFGPYLVLERLHGSDLAKLAPMGRRFGLPLVAAIALQVCDTLKQAHAIGIVHRDIKPSNLFLSRGPEGREIVKVLDFGVSKLKQTAHWDGQPTLTSADGPLGSPQFISPEQLVDARSVDGRTDLWSLGVVMYRLLAGSYPFAGASVTETFAAVLNGPIAPLALLGVEVPASFQAVLDRCLARSVDDRYASAEELASALRPFASSRIALDGDLDAGALDDEELATAPDPPRPFASSSLRVSTATAPAARRGGILGWALLGGGFLGVLVLARLLTPHGPAVAPPASPEIVGSIVAPLAVPTAFAVATNEASADVELELTAALPIVAVRAPGLRRLVIQGRDARLAVAPWTGALAVEAELEGGARARAEVQAGGPAQLELVRDRSPASATSGSGSVAVGAVAPPPQAGRGVLHARDARGKPPFAPPPLGPAEPKPRPKADASAVPAPGGPSSDAPSELRRNPYL